MGFKIYDRRRNATEKSYCQILCMKELGGVLNFFYPVDKIDSSNDFVEQFMAM
jgi:hypothetical protein